MNWIHIMDIARCIEFVIDHSITGRVINVVAPSHPDRKSFYNEFFPEQSKNIQWRTPNNFKTISPNTLQTLGFEWAYPNNPIHPNQTGDINE